MNINNIFVHWANFLINKVYDLSFLLCGRCTPHICSGWTSRSSRVVGTFRYKLGRFMGTLRVGVVVMINVKCNGVLGKNYLKARAKNAGVSSIIFQSLTNLATVAPSTTLWSALRLAASTSALYTFPLSSNLGSC